MWLKTMRRRLFQLALTSVALLGLMVPTASAQHRLFHLPAFNLAPSPSCDVCSPSTTAAPSTAPQAGTPTPGGAGTPTPGVSEPSLQPVTTAALGGGDMAFGPGYIDNALPYTHFRLRFDSARDANRPDRAEFFYPKCGCFGPPAPGPVLPETSVDYQEISAYLEFARSDRFSVFAQFPIRFINPVVNDNATGLGDITTGFKYALLRCDQRVVTFQGRMYIPSGDPDRGLGTDHVSLEPSLLFSQQLSDRLMVFGQLGDWIPIGGTDFAGNVAIYGAGLRYTLLQTCNWNVAPVVELLGWSVLGGQQSVPPQNFAQDASGDTIINAKFGVRIWAAASNQSGLLSNSNVYIGYGRALTGDVWYKDIFRLEYEMSF